MNIYRLFRRFCLFSFVVQAIFCGRIEAFNRIDHVKIVYFSSKSAYEAKRTKLLKQAMIGVAVVGSGVVIYNWLSTPIPPKLPCPTIKEDSTCSELIKELLTESNENKKQIAAMHQGMVTAGILAPSNQGIVEWLLSWKPLFLNALMSTLVTASLSPVLKYFKIF